MRRKDFMGVEVREVLGVLGLATWAPKWPGGPSAWK